MIEMMNRIRDVRYAMCDVRRVGNVETGRAPSLRRHPPQWRQRKGRSPYIQLRRAAPYAHKTKSISSPERAQSRYGLWMAPFQGLWDGWDFLS